jgi:hypothetical protein
VNFEALLKGGGGADATLKTLKVRYLVVFR